MMSAPTHLDPVPLETPSQDWPRKYQIGAWCLAACYFGWFLWQFGAASLWLDETLTAWVTSGDLQTCWRRAWDFQGQSPLFFVLIWLVRQCFGDSEMVLRSLSFLALISTALITRSILIQIGMYRDAWVGALVVAVAMISDFDIGASARPYALAILCSALSMLFLLRWLERRSWNMWLAYSAASFATIAFHYLFATMVVLHFVIILAMGKLSAQGVLRWCGSWCAVGVGLIPFVPHVMAVSRKADRYEFSLPPTVDSTLHYLIATDGVFYIALTAVVLGIFWPRRCPASVDKRVAWLGAGWWIAGPLSILLFYLCFGISVNVPRYFAWRVPALGLIVVASIQLIYAHRLLALPVMIVLGFVMPVVRESDRTGWKDALAFGAQYTDTSAGYEPVVYTGLIETADRTWINQDQFSEYMRAPIHHYGGPSEAHLLPIRAPRAAKLYESKLQELFTLHDQLVFIMRLIPPAGGDVKQRAIQAGYDIETSKHFGLVEVIVIRRQEGKREVAVHR